VTAENVPDHRPPNDVDLSLEELALRQGVVPVQSVHDMAA